MTSLRYLFNGTGPLASSTYDAHLLYRTGLNDDLGSFPDVQIGCAVGSGDRAGMDNLNFVR